MSPSDSVGPPLAAADPGVAIRLTDVVCRGRRGDALRGVTLSLHEGERVALFGAAGCGKTMLLRVLSGEVRPDAGEVQPSAFGTVYVAEEPPQPGRLSVRDKLMWRLSRRGLPQQAPALPPLQRAARVAEAMELLDLDTARDVPERELSRTQRIALDIAGAVASDAALLLLDNVTACLAEPVTARLFAYLDGRRAADGLTWVHATCASHEAERADRVVALHDGAVLACEPPADLLRRLATDTVTIEADDPAEVQRTARGIFDVEIVEDPRGIRFRARDSIEVAAQVMRHPAGGASVVHVRRGTLWDAYARLIRDGG